jgi:2-methylcitrate dehydratase
MTDGIITAREANRFLEAVQNLAKLPAGELGQLNIALPKGTLLEAKPGIF